MVRTEESRQKRVATQEEEAAETRGKSRASSAAQKPVSPRKSQYLFSSRAVPGFPPISFEQLQRALKEAPDTEVVNVLTFDSAKTSGRFEAMPGASRVLIARMPDSTAQMLQQAVGPQLLIERDNPLTFGSATIPLCKDPGLFLNRDQGVTVSVVAEGDDGPIENAQVYVFGDEWPARSTTGKNGRAEITIAGDSPETVRGVFIKPESDYWSLWLANPSLDPDGDNKVKLLSLRESIPGLSKTAFVGWGLRAMKIDQLPPAFRGRGVKVGLIDSGVAGSHNSLERSLKEGIDLTSDDPNGWKSDENGHGTFSAGVIVGNPAEGAGIRGCAPEAELVVCKVHPDGRYSDLLQALEYCIQKQVDIVCLNVAGIEPSELVEQALLKAKLLGIPCIAAAGDFGAPIQGIAGSPNVLAVSAIGKLGEFPNNSYEAQTIAGRVQAEGYFSASFSAFGPHISVCAPGVAVVSTASPNNFMVADSTCAAAAHVTGLAALILAHHPEFQVTQEQGRTRSPQLVDRLFQIIRQSAQLLDLGDISRTGMGIPDATRAFAPEMFALRPGFAGLAGAMAGAMSGFGGVPSMGTITSMPSAPVTFPINAWPFGFPARPAASADDTVAARAETPHRKARVR
jgi:subtilisin